MHDVIAWPFYACIQFMNVHYAVDSLLLQGLLSTRKSEKWSMMRGGEYATEPVQMIHFTHD